MNKSYQTFLFNLLLLLHRDNDNQSESFYLKISNVYIFVIFPLYKMNTHFALRSIWHYFKKLLSLFVKKNVFLLLRAYLLFLWNISLLKCMITIACTKNAQQTSLNTFLKSNIQTANNATFHDLHYLPTLCTVIYNL